MTSGFAFFIENEMTITWPIWECISPLVLALLIQYQWDNYGLKLDLMSDPFTEIESREELGRLMKQKPEHPRMVK